jgi:hypothetical protein
MSVSIATMGKFNQCCGTRVSGGAPPYRPDSEAAKPFILVKHMDIKTTNSIEDYLSKIKVKLISFDNKQMEEE